AGDQARPVRQLRLRRMRAVHRVVPGRHRHHRGGRGAASRSAGQTSPGRRDTGRCAMSGVTPADLADHAFLLGMADGHLAVLARDCWVVPWRRRAGFLGEGAPGGVFWLPPRGRVALGAHARGARRLFAEPRGKGVLPGLSWLVPPYQWQFSATAVADAMTFEFNADAVR